LLLFLTPPKGEFLFFSTFLPSSLSFLSIMICHLS
jgi:hypothetical protein